MKKLIIGLLLVSTFAFGAYKTASQTLYDMNYEAPVPTTITAQTMVASWTNLGSEIDVSGKSAMGLWISLTAKSTVNARFRALARHTASGTQFNFPIKTVGTADVKVEPEYFELNVDADQNIMIPIELDRLANYVQFQYMAGTVGTGVGSVSGSITLGWK